VHYLKRRFLLNCLRIADVGVMAIAFAVAFVLSGQTSAVGDLGDFLAMRIKLVNFAFFAAWALTWHLVFRYFGLYRSRRVGLMTAEWWDITKAVSIGTVFLAGVALVFDLTAVNRVFLATFFVVGLLGTIIVRTCLRAFLGEIRRGGRNLRNVVIVGCGKRGAEFGNEIRNRPDFGYLLLGYIDDIVPPDNPLHGSPEKLLGSIDEMREVLTSNEVDEVIITLPIKSYYETISDLIALCEELCIVVRIQADFFESHLVNAFIDDFEDKPVITLRAHAPSAGAAAIKRFVDVVASAIALILLSPLMAIIALVIKLDFPGSVFFVQNRIGLRRRHFRLVKFRTMRVDAEDEIEDLEALNEVAGAAFKMENDPRVTRVGRILRKLSLDELPQFWNVLRGDMSLVGPRPLPDRDVERFDRAWQRRRFSVKPGITCLWQINGRHEIDFEHWMELDLEYINNWSLSMDFDILLKTLPAALRGTGAS
jgi:exopolysaccharide biosynthesis polyprenyl glycosylphosphotransferase